MANECSKSRGNGSLTHPPRGCRRQTTHLLGGGALSLLGQSQRIRRDSRFKRGAAWKARRGGRGQARPRLVDTSPFSAVCSVSLSLLFCFESRRFCDSRDDWDWLEWLWERDLVQARTTGETTDFRKTQNAIRFSSFHSDTQEAKRRWGHRPEWERACHRENLGWFQEWKHSSKELIPKTPPNHTKTNRDSAGMSVSSYPLLLPLLLLLRPTAQTQSASNGCFIDEARVYSLARACSIHRPNQLQSGGEELERWLEEAPNNIYCKLNHGKPGCRLKNECCAGVAPFEPTRL